MLRECPVCGYQQDSNIDIFGCGGCGMELDFSPYLSPYLNCTPPSQYKGGDVIIDNAKGMSPFFKKGDIEVGTEGVIKSEFVPSGKFMNPTGEVDFSGNILKVSLNKTSLYDIVKAYGNDTAKWIGKKIIYSIEEVETKQGAVYRDVSIFRAVR